MEKRAKFLMSVGLVVLILGLASTGCTKKKDTDKNQTKTEENQQNKETEATEETKPQDDNSQETGDEPIQYDDVRDTTNRQPYKEYVDMFPKWIPEEYIPRCHSYFIGDPYTDGNIVYRLTISTGCTGEYNVVYKLEKCKVVKNVDGGNYVNSTTGEDGELQDNFETTTTLYFDDSACQNLSQLKGTSNDEIPYVKGYAVTDEYSDGVYWTGGISTVISQINYNPGTTIEHDIEYYGFEDVYGIGAYVDFDMSKLKSDDVITVQTNIEPFASEINGKQFKADWEIDKGYYDDLTLPYVTNDISNGYDYGYKYDNDYPKAAFYDSLLY